MASRFVPVLMLLLSLSACGGGSSEPASPTASAHGGEESPPVEAASRSGAPIVELLNPGAEPRAPLRIQVREGDSGTLRMTLRMTMAMSVDGRSMPTSPIPPIESDMTSRIVAVSPDGVARREWEIDTFIIKGEGPVADRMREYTDALVGAGGWDLVDPRGRILGAEIQVPPAATAEQRQRLEQSQSNLKAATIPFPEEPVGVGAHWRATTRLTSPYELTQVAHYTLEERAENGTVVLKVSTTLEASPQAIETPSGNTGRLNGLRGQVEGRVRVQPNGYDSDGVLDTQLRIDSEVDRSGGEPAKAVTEIETHYAFEPIPTE